MNPKFSAYAHPEALVDGEWLQAHLADPGIRVVESNEDVLLYDTGHIAGAVHIDWRGDLQDNTVRDYVTPAGFAAVCSRHGITPATTVIFYGDKSNWWAGYALWAFRLFGHSRVRLLDGFYLLQAFAHFVEHRDSGFKQHTTVVRRLDP